MRGPIRRHLLATFQREFEKRYPNFKRIDSEGIWAQQIAPSLFVFVHLSPFEGQDIFVVDLAWGETDEIPWNCRNRELNYHEKEWLYRMGRFWKPSGLEPTFDLTPEEKIASKARIKAWARDEPALYPPPVPIATVLTRVEPAVEACLKKFKKYVVPVFNNLAHSRGLGDIM